MSSLTLATFFFLRHLPDAPGRGIGKPLRTTNRSRLVFRYTSNIPKAPQPNRQNIAGSRNGKQLRPTAMDRQAATDRCGWRDVSESPPGFHLIAGEPTPAANPFRALELQPTDEAHSLNRHCKVAARGSLQATQEGRYQPHACSSLQLPLAAPSCASPQDTRAAETTIRFRFANIVP